MKKENTKSSIIRTFKELLETKTIDKITVTEISEVLQINRQTFYYHFDDVYQVAQQLFHDEAISIFSSLDCDSTWKDGIDSLFDYIVLNKKMCFHSVSSLGSEWFYLLFYKELYQLLLVTVNKEEHESNLSAKEKDQLAKFYIISIGAYIIAWINGVVEGDPMQIRDFIKTKVVD